MSDEIRFPTRWERFVTWLLYKKEEVEPRRYRFMNGNVISYKPFNCSRIVFVRRMWYRALDRCFGK